MSRAVLLAFEADLATLTACSPFVNQDPYRAEELEAGLTRLLAEVPCEELSLTLGGDVWELLEGATEGSEKR